MSAAEFTGPIDNRRKKGDLVAIAEGLGLPSTGTIKELIPHIKTYVKDHQATLATDARFQKLIMYRPSGIWWITLEVTPRLCWMLREATVI
jgi:hypothetical protein